MTGQNLPLHTATARLRLLATTDLHAHLIGYDYYTDRPSAHLGLSRIATLIQDARDTAKETDSAVLLLDNGDGFQGAAIGENVLHGEPLPHPLVTCFNTLNYDALGMGNHDFNYGLPTLERLLRDANCPAICTNMSAIETGLELPFQASTIVEKQLPNHPNSPPLRIGILSVLPPQTVIWDAYFLEGRVVVQDMVHAARDTAQALREQGCDLVVALAHTGLSDTDHMLNMENALYPLTEIGEIDAFVAGHTHLQLPDPDTPMPKPVVMPGAFGSHLGVIDFELRQQDGRWKVDRATPHLKPVILPETNISVPENEALRAAIDDAHQECRRRLNQPVGRVAQPLHSYFTFFAKDRSLAMSACAQAAAVRAYVKGTAASELPLLSAVAPGKFGARAGPSFYTDVPAGDVSLRHVIDLQIFPNRLRAVEVVGSELAEWLEMSAGMFSQIHPGSSDQELVDPNRAGHNYDVIYGVEYEIDLSQPARFNISGTLVNPAANRIRNLRWNGMRVDPNQRFLVGVNSYRASGGGHFNMVRYAPQLNLPSVRLRDVIRDYIAGDLPLDPLEQAPHPWRFSPMENTKARAFTGPAAKPHLSELDLTKMRPLPLDENGFLPLEIDL